MKRQPDITSALDGLSVGDAFGAAFERLPFDTIRRRELPPGPWRWGDATSTALATAAALGDGIDPATLAAALGERYRAWPWRAPRDGSEPVLMRIAAGVDWRIAAAAATAAGSAAAARGVVVGAAYRGEPARAAGEARRAAEVTHGDGEAQAGAMAVAAAAALAGAGAKPGGAFIEAVLPHVPEGELRARLAAAVEIGPDRFSVAERVLGTGRRRRAVDTVPFALWVVAWHRDYEDAAWHAAAGMGDRPTVLALVGGLVSAWSPPPAAWQAAREPLLDAPSGEALAAP